MTAKELGWLLRAFGDGTRVRLLAALSEGEQSVGDLVRTAGRAWATVSRHLQYLDRRGIVQWRTVRGSVRYRLAKPHDAVRKQMLAAFLAVLSNVEDIPARSTLSSARRRKPTH